MKNVSFMLKNFFVEILKLMSWVFGYTEKQHGKMAKVNFKMFDVMDWTINNYNIHIS